MPKVINQKHVLVFIVAYKILSWYVKVPIKSLRKLQACYHGGGGRLGPNWLHWSSWSDIASPHILYPSWKSKTLKKIKKSQTVNYNCFNRDALLKFKTIPLLSGCLHLYNFTKIVILTILARKHCYFILCIITMNKICHWNLLTEKIKTVAKIY